MSEKIRVGVVGASAERGWALWTHRPALAALPQFRVTAVAASSPASAGAAARAWGAEHHFADPAELIEHPDVDLVVLAVVLPRRSGLVEAAAAAGKHVYCEWPFAASLDEAERLAAAVARAGVRGAVGLQTRFHPAIEHVAGLLADGFIGDLLSVSFQYALSTPATWPEGHRFMIGTPNVSRLMVVGGHALDLFRALAGDFAELSATLSTRVPFAVLAESGDVVPDPSPDQILVTGQLDSGAAASVHITTGSPAGDGYRIELYGRAGRLVLTSADDSLVGPRFTLLGSEGRSPLRPLPLPEAGDEPVAVRNVRRVYSGIASAIHTGQRVAPDPATAVELHALLHGIEESARLGRRVNDHRRTL